MKSLDKILYDTFTPRTVKSDPQRKAREEAKKLAANRGFEIERLKDGGFNVWPPKDAVKDNFEGDHFARDWGEVLPMARWYAIN